MIQNWLFYGIIKPDANEIPPILPEIAEVEILYQQICEKAKWSRDWTRLEYTPITRKKDRREC